MKTSETSPWIRELEPWEGIEELKGLSIKRLFGTLCSSLYTPSTDMDYHAQGINNLSIPRNNKFTEFNLTLVRRLFLFSP